MKKFFGNLCMLLGAINLAMVWIKCDSYAAQLIISTSAICMFAFFMLLAAILLSDEKESDYEM